MPTVADLIAAFTAGAAVVSPAVGYLWRELSRARRTRREQRPKQASSPGAPLVLLVEDNPVDAMLFVAAVEPLDVRVAVASSAEEALALATEWPAVVVVDARLPGLSGVELVKRLRPAVVVLSASDPEDLARYVADCGADLGLQKRGDLNAVREAVARLVR